jgi:hypothetical protein
LFTRYCSKQCNSRHYKQLAKEEKAKVLNAQLTSTATSPTDTLANTAQEYFEVNEVAQLMRISTRTLFRRIEKKKKLLSRKVIMKDDINHFLLTNKTKVMKRKAYLYTNPSSCSKIKKGHVGKSVWKKRGLKTDISRLVKITISLLL